MLTWVTIQFYFIKRAASNRVSCMYASVQFWSFPMKLLRLLRPVASMSVSDNGHNGLSHESHFLVKRHSTVTNKFDDIPQWIYRSVITLTKFNLIQARIPGKNMSFHLECYKRTSVWSPSSSSPLFSSQKVDLAHFQNV